MILVLPFKSSLQIQREIFIKLLKKNNLKVQVQGFVIHDASDNLIFFMNDIHKIIHYSIINFLLYFGLVANEKNGYVQSVYIVLYQLFISWSIHPFPFTFVFLCILLCFFIMEGSTFHSSQIHLHNSFMLLFIQNVLFIEIF